LDLIRVIGGGALAASRMASFVEKTTTYFERLRPRDAARIAQPVPHDGARSTDAIATGVRRDQIVALHLHHALLLRLRYSSSHIEGRALIAGVAQLSGADRRRTAPQARSPLPATTRQVRAG